MPFQPDRMRAARKRKRIGIRKLGKLMKIGHQQLQKYESGTVKPGAERLEAIADALETNVSYLLGRTDYERALTDKHYRLADAYDRGDRNAILDILRKHLAEQDFSEPVVPRVKPGPKRQSAKRR